MTKDDSDGVDEGLGHIERMPDTDGFLRKLVRRLDGSTSDEESLALSEFARLPSSTDELTGRVTTTLTTQSAHLGDEVRKRIAASAPTLMSEESTLGDSDSALQTPGRLQGEATQASAVSSSTRRATTGSETSAPPVNWTARLLVTLACTGVAVALGWALGTWL